MKVCVVDWQVAYHGHGPTDLCYLIYSSSTKFMRDKYLDYFLDLYYETLTELLEKLNIAFTPTFEEFHGEFIQSIPYCLLFCANADDFILGPDQGKDYIKKTSCKFNLLHQLFLKFYQTWPPMKK